MESASEALYGCIMVLGTVVFFWALIIGFIYGASYLLGWLQDFTERREDRRG